MMSTVGLELTNFLNPDLTWKTVSKGNRSTTRRTRKSAIRDLTAGVELAVKRSRGEEDSTVSESEKLGVAVLGRRFSDKIEHVPIKKRKFNLRSPSPPPCAPSSCIEVVQHASSQGLGPNSNGKGLVRPVVNGYVSESVNQKLGYSEDFSGIEMLAAAACNNDLDVDQAKENPVMEESLQKENESTLVEETVAPLETASLSSKDLVVEERIEDLSFQDVSSTSAQKSPSDKEDKMVERSVSLRDNRLHWDLNVVIDAWDQPCNIENVGSQTNSAEIASVVEGGKLQILDGCETERETKDVRHDGMDCNNDEYGADAKASTQVVSTDACLSNVPCENNGASNTFHLEGKIGVCTSGVQENEIFCVENVEVEKYDVASSFVLALDRVACEVDSTTLDENVEDSGRASSSAPQGMLIKDKSQTLMVSLGMEPASKAEEGINHPLPRCDEVSTSSDFVEEVQPVVAGVAMGLADEAHWANASGIDSSVCIGPEKLMDTSSGNLTDSMEIGCAFTTHEKCIGNTPTSSAGDIKIEDPSENIHESATAQDNEVHINGIQDGGEAQAGYDSQFEDGELRESDLHCREENEGEGAEIEQVDYESECDVERLCILEVEDAENKRKNDGGFIPGSGVTAEDTEQCAVGDVFGDHLISSKMRNSESTDGSKLKNHTVDCGDGPYSKDLTYGVGPPRLSKREFISRDQGSISSDAEQRNRVDDFDDSCPRSVREVASNKFMGRDRSTSDTRCRSPGDGHIVHTRQSPTYNAPYGSGRPRPRNIIESRGFVMTSTRTISEAAAVEGFDNHVRRQYLSSSSNGVYRPLNRRYLAYRDDVYGTQAGTTLGRADISPDRSRFRKYPQGVYRGIREDHRPVPYYSSEYTDHIPHRLSRRERSISPPSGERLHYSQSYKKSLSRSRSRSPSAWLSSRDRNEGLSRRSRSPNFRSARVDRFRLSFQKRFPADYDEDFMSPPRNRFSPQRNSRYDDRISALDNLRDRKSPVRMFRQNQRFDSVHSVRGMGHPRRYPDMSGSGRGYKYEDAKDDRRKRENKYETMHRVRRYDTDGVTRRLRYSAEDAFLANES